VRGSILLEATLASTVMAALEQERSPGRRGLRLRIDQLIDRPIQLVEPGILPTASDNPLPVERESKDSKDSQEAWTNRRSVSF
jgi:hypothetical protein